MLPYKQAKGRDAYKSLKVYLGVPQEFEGQEMVQVDEAVPKNVAKSVELGKISHLLGAKF